MRSQGIVKLRGQRSKLRQIIPGDRREIVMFIMITHVERHPVNRPVIAERFLVRIERVVFLHPARSYRMKADGKEKRTSQIPEAEPAAEIENGETVTEDGKDIHYLPGIPHCDRSQARRP